MSPPTSSTIVTPSARITASFGNVMWCWPIDAGERGSDGENDEQVDADERLDERKRPAAQVVRYLQAEQRVAGHPCDAGEERDDHDRDQGKRKVRQHRHDGQRHTRADDRHPEQSASAHLSQQPRTDAHTERQTDEDRAEQHAVRGVATAEQRDVRAAQRDHRTAGGERSEDADHQTADERRDADEPPALDDHRKEAERHDLLGVRPLVFGTSPADRGQR